MPRPLLTLVASTPDEEPHTAIVRRWSPGDCDRCTRCPECAAIDDTCLVLVAGPVPDGEAWNYRIEPPRERGERASSPLEDPIAV